MHHKAFWILTGAVVAVFGALVYGCTGGGSCADLETCPLPDTGGGNAMNDGGGEDTDSAMNEASSAEEHFTCDPTKEPKDASCVLDDMYGVFVASSAAMKAGTDSNEGGAGSGGDGSMSHPYATIGQALANLGGKTRVYVCNGLYDEQVTIQTSVGLYGGLSCPAGDAGPVWIYVGGSAQVTSPLPAYALSVAGVMGVTIEDVSFTAPDATSAGGSSIAVLISSSAVNMRRVTLTAGRGMDGAAGDDGTANANYTGSPPSGGSQVMPGPAGSGMINVVGGKGAVNKCTNVGVSAGGDGGLGCSGKAGLGSPGTATPAAPATVAGRDGLPADWPLGDGGVDAGTTANNDPGADGLAGDGGPAAPASSYGILSPTATAWVPHSGADGDPGNPGQGGAGATDPHYGSCSTSTQSVGGGGGGAGGCGGAGGKGGGGGGASIALASVTSTIDLQECKLVAAPAGTGGAGGAGQDGQAGGAGGDTNFPADHAAGASGGNGAGGSGGAGGTGGISVGLLYLGSMITSDMATTQNTKLGAPGAGGAAGPGGRHGTGATIMTGQDGHPGATGNAGTAAPSLGLM